MATATIDETVGMRQRAIAARLKAVNRRRAGSGRPPFSIQELLDYEFSRLVQQWESVTEELESKDIYERYKDLPDGQKDAIDRILDGR